MVQLTLCIVASVLIWGQKSELNKRLVAIEQLKFVNQCGDKFTQVPNHFIPDIEAADSRVVLCVIMAVV